MRRVALLVTAAIVITLVAVGAVLAVPSRRVPGRFELRVATPLPDGAVVTPMDARTPTGPCAMPEGLVVFTSHDARMLFVFQRSGATVADAVESLTSAGWTRTYGQLTHAASSGSSDRLGEVSWFECVPIDDFSPTDQSAVNQAFVDTLKENARLRRELESGDRE